jgi:hypothetical protein
MLRKLQENSENSKLVSHSFAILVFNFYILLVYFLKLEIKLKSKVKKKYFIRVA